jgi:hypothetical protein
MSPFVSVPPAANLAAANALAGGISRTDPLPAPAAGAMEGRLVC